MLVLLAEHAPNGTLQLGQGYLISDYPMTEAVLRDGLEYRMTLADPGVDAQEAKVVRTLGFGALLMLSLGAPPEPWGLVEVYRRSATPFLDDEVQAARELLARTAARLPVS